MKKKIFEYERTFVCWKIGDSNVVSLKEVYINYNKGDINFRPYIMFLIPNADLRFSWLEH